MNIPVHFFLRIMEIKFDDGNFSRFLNDSQSLRDEILFCDSVNP